MLNANETIKSYLIIIFNTRNFSDYVLEYTLRFMEPKGTEWEITKSYVTNRNLVLLFRHFLSNSGHTVLFDIGEIIGCLTKPQSLSPNQPTWACTAGISSLSQSKACHYT